MRQHFTGLEIAQATGGELRTDAAAGPIVTDTRRIVPGCWFLALRGERFDGHAFVAEAVKAGAVGVIVASSDGGPQHSGCVVVSDTLRALQDLALDVRRSFEGVVVGVTGSAGKTTTRALIASAMESSKSVHATQGNWNNHIGLPLTLLSSAGDEDTWVVEMGTSSPGEIARLSEIAVPNVRVIVNVGHAHLEELGGLDGVAHEKGALFRSARPGDVVCVNVDDPFVRDIPIPAKVDVITWGRSSEAQYRLCSVDLEPETFTMRARYQTPFGSVEVQFPVAGAHVALDGAAALAVACRLGVGLREAAEGFATYAPVGMRLRLLPLRNGVRVINDAYNANPQSMNAALDLLALMDGQTIAVMGDMLELGETEHQLHHEVLEYALGTTVDWVVAIGPRMGRAAHEIRSARLRTFDTPEAAVPWLTEQAISGGTWLLKGSRGIKVEAILEGFELEGER